MAAIPASGGMIIVTSDEVAAEDDRLKCFSDFSPSSSSQLVGRIVGEAERKFSSTDEVSEHSQDESVVDGEYFLDRSENVESERTWGGLKESSPSASFGLEGASIGRTVAEP